MENRPVWKSTPALISFMLCVLSWALSAFVFVIHHVVAPDWFGPDRERAAYAVSLALTFFHAFIGRRLLRTHFTSDQSRRSVNARQAVIIILILVAAGVFVTWLCSQGREPR